MIVRFSVFAVFLAALGGCSQLRSSSADDSSAAASAPSASSSSRSSGDGPKPYSEVITEDVTTDPGLFTVHLGKEGLQLLVEIPDSLFGREMLVVSRIARTAEGFGYGGTKVNTQAVRWEHQGNHALLRTVRYASVASDSLPIYQAVRNATFDPVVARVPVAAYSDDSSSVVLDVTDLFAGDTPIFGLPQRAREQFKVSRLDKERSFLSHATAYPLNLEVRAVLTYAASNPPTNSSTGTISVEMAHSMIVLPAEQMRYRRIDPRVGYLGIQNTDYGLPVHRAEARRYATRWRLVPSDVDAYARGELVEPVTPITYYIDPATPAEWVEYLKMGVEDWNVAFEAAGFRNAIRALDAPTAEEDPNWSPEDARYSVIRYYPSDIENASGPHVHDPRSGEILETDINWYHNVMNLLRNWFFIQTAAVNPEARTANFKTELMGQLVRFVSSHEVGHTLGLPHNFISSSAYAVDSLRSPTFTANHGTAPSIMDYARFNYIAQPGDGVTQLMPAIGEYDKWSINWGYRYFPNATSEEEERRALQQMVLERADDPAMQYGAQTGDPVDPRSQSEDLGDNSVRASELGLANLKRIVPNLMAWSTEDGEDYETLSELYGNVVGQWNRYLGHVSRNVGGVEIHTKLAGQQGEVYVPVDADRQRDAVAFLVNEAFADQDWLVQNDVLRRIEPAGMLDRVQRLQEGALDRLLDPVRIGRLLEGEMLDTSAAYKASELFESLRTGLWSELSGGSAISATRRSLQRAHVDRLGELMGDGADGPAADFQSAVYGYRSVAGNRSDIQPMARGELLALQSSIGRAVGRYNASSKRMERLHLVDLQARIKDILDPKE